MDIYRKVGDTGPEYPQLAIRKLQNFAILVKINSPDKEDMLLCGWLQAKEKLDIGIMFQRQLHIFN